MRIAFTGHRPNKLGGYDNKTNYKRNKAGQQVNLVCWCAPLACHGDVIKAFIESLK